MEKQWKISDIQGFEKKLLMNIFRIFLKMCLNSAVSENKDSKQGFGVIL